MMSLPLMFDLDGTLFQAHLLSISAFHRTFDRLCQAGLWDRTPTDDSLKKVYGMTESELWHCLLPGAPASTHKLASRWMEEAELANLNRGLGALFPGAKDALARLHSAGHRLFVISNGGESYVKGVCSTFGLAPMLTGVYSAGQYRTSSKSRLLALAKEHHQLARGIMVGDRDSDIAAGLDNGFVTVGCTYGYGSIDELNRAHYIIDHISQILHLVGKEQADDS